MAGWRGLLAYVRARPLLADSLLAVALFVVGNGLVGTVPRDVLPANVPVALAWSAAGMATVAIRRRWPWVAVVALSAHATVTSVVGVATEGLAILVLTYTVAAYLSIRHALAALVLLWVPAIVTASALGHYTATPVRYTMFTFLAFNVMMAMVAFLTGRIVFTRRRYVAALVERALAAEQNQQALADRAVEDERRRIARELHDMVAHHVSVMSVLATGSRRMLGKDPGAVDEALATIEETGRTALREMRRLLDVLRTEPPQGLPGREPTAEPTSRALPAAGYPLAPQPGVAGLAGLVDQVREAGLPVSVRTTGEPGMLDPAVALTVYRVVQEALTNVLKHGGSGATAEVRLDVNGRWLTLEVFDTGRGPLPRPADTAVDGVGHGLLGMRERVGLFGGTLRTGPRPGGGFRVYARIPIEEGAHG
jgi:signal transduction histidine kinase